MWVNCVVCTHYLNVRAFSEEGLELPDLLDLAGDAFLVESCVEVTDFKQTLFVGLILCELVEVDARLSQLFQKLLRRWLLCRTRRLLAWGLRRGFLRRRWENLLSHRLLLVQHWLQVLVVLRFSWLFSLATAINNLLQNNVIGLLSLVELLIELIHQLGQLCLLREIRFHLLYRRVSSNN